MISFAKSLSPTYEIPFPAVTICPESKAAKNEIDFSKIALQSNFTHEEILKLKALSQVCDFQDFENLGQLMNLTKSVGEDVIATLEELANPMKKMFKRCRYGSHQLSDCEQYFSKVITDEGVCWVFNMMDQSDLFKNDTMDPSIRLPDHGNASEWFFDTEYESAKIKVYPRRVIGSGLQSGLSIELKMNSFELNPGCKRGIQGFRLSLHTPIEIPQMSKHFYSIPFKKLTSLSVKPGVTYPSRHVKAYDPISRQCFFNQERKLKFFKTYAKSSCDLECLADQTLALCGCVKFSMPHHNTTQICDHSKLECVYVAEKNQKTRDLKRKLLDKQLKQDLKNGKITENDEGFTKLKNMKSCKCLPSCTSLHYDVEISQTDFYIDEDQE